jgi:hypothetical protein
MYQNPSETSKMVRTQYASAADHEYSISTGTILVLNYMKVPTLSRPRLSFPTYVIGHQITMISVQSFPSHFRTLPLIFELCLVNDLLA